jgi:hypothetical protein
MIEKYRGLAEQCKIHPILAKLWQVDCYVKGYILAKK